MNVSLKSFGKRRQLCLLGGTLLLAYGLLRVSYRAILNQCDGNTFVYNLCQQYAAGMVGGPACEDVCADWAWYFACPKTPYDEHSSQVSLRKHWDVVYAIRRQDFDAVVAGKVNPLSDTQRSSHGYTKEDLYGAASRYLSPVGCNSFWSLLSRHVSVDHRKYLGPLLANGEFILRSLYAGLAEAPVADWSFCGPLYKSSDIHTNFTNSLEIQLETISKVQLSIVKRLPVLQWLQIVKQLFAFEQSIGDHAEEQRFLMCNLTADKIFLHNKCFVRPLGSGTCSFRVAELSTTLISEDALVSSRRSVSCTSDSECGYASCRGACVNSTCLPLWSSYMAGIRSVCSLFDNIYSRHLWWAMTSDRRGKWQVLFEKCIEAMPQDSNRITADGSSWEQRLPLVIAYNAIAGSLINFVTEEISIQTGLYNKKFGV